MTPTAVPHLPRVLKMGMRGLDVVALRRALYKAGLSTWDEYERNASPHTKMGPVLASRLKVYQARHRLTADGEMGNLTYHSLVSSGAMDAYALSLITRAGGQSFGVDKASLVVATAYEGVRQASWIHYSQGFARWEGIRNHLLGPNQPSYADCSSYVTWLFWQARYRVDGTPGEDIYNGESWEGGFTGTLVRHGTLSSLLFAKPGRSLVFYGTPDDDNMEHVAVYVGRNMVVSHGSEGGPYHVPYNYRDDVRQVRTYAL